MACRTGCPTQDHRSWGECARQSDFRVAYCGQGGGDATKEKKWQKEIDAYRSARAEGIQPSGTSMPKIRKAVEISDKTGRAYQAPA